MNAYIECFLYGKLKKRYRVTQIEESGINFLKKALEIDGYKINILETEEELETGIL